MADEFKTMKLFAKVDQDTHYFQGVYQCKVCHGVLIDRGLNSLVDPPADDDGQIINWTCPMCDASAPLSRRYRMALCTVGWQCPSGYIQTETAPFGFPSFKNACSGYRREIIMLHFDYKGTAIVASDNDISLFYQSKDKAFEDMLDGRPDQLIQKTHVDKQALARDVVDRVRHDLKLNYAKEA